jgi:hypothetical protein
MGNHPIRPSNPIPIKPPEKSENPENPEIKAYFPALDRFMEEIKIQDYLSKSKKETKDKILKELIEYEEKELTESFEKAYKEYKENILKKLPLKLNIDNQLILNIIQNENSINVYKRKIMDDIISIKEDESLYRINYLKILLVGRKRVGKTTLIKYMLNKEDLNDNDNDNNKAQNFVEYVSNQVPYLKLVEFRGIGLEENNSPEIVGDEALKCIKEKIDNNNGTINGDYNDFFHCIWYCVSGAKFEQSEINVLEKLSDAYIKMKMPIIVVYTQNTDNNLSNAFMKYIQKKKLNASFIKVLARDIKIMGSNKTFNAYGRDDLLEESLKKCTMALEGDMINFMTNSIADNVKQNKLERNKKK